MDSVSPSETQMYHYPPPGIRKINKIPGNKNENTVEFNSSCNCYGVNYEPAATEKGQSNCDTNEYKNLDNFADKLFSRFHNCKIIDTHVFENSSSAGYFKGVGYEYDQENSDIDPLKTNRYFGSSIKWLNLPFNKIPILQKERSAYMERNICAAMKTEEYLQNKSSVLKKTPQSKGTFSYHSGSKFNDNISYIINQKTGEIWELDFCQLKDEKSVNAAIDQILQKRIGP